MRPSPRVPSSSRPADCPSACPFCPLRLNIRQKTLVILGNRAGFVAPAPSDRDVARVMVNQLPEHFPEKRTPVFRKGNATSVESRALSGYGLSGLVVSLIGKRSTDDIRPHASSGARGALT